MGAEAGVIDAVVNETVVDVVIEKKEEEEDGTVVDKARKKKIEKQGDIERAVNELETINSVTSFNPLWKFWAPIEPMLFVLLLWGI